MFNGFDKEMVGTGWGSILENLAEEIKTILAASKEPIDARVDQVKEKFAYLRIYVSFIRPREDGTLLISPFMRTVEDEDLWNTETAQAVQRAIMEAERMSGKICEECGAPGEARGVKGKKYSWLKTLCQIHHAERDARSA